MDQTREELKRLREVRKKLAGKLAESVEQAIAHVENGSFELVEQALVECQEGICELKNKIESKRTKRRASINVDSTEQASRPAG